MIIMPTKSVYVKFNNYERKIRSRFMIYADLHSISVYNGKKNQKEFYTNKY